MRTKNTHVRYEAVPYGAVAHLLASDIVPTSAILRHDAAAQALADADTDAIVAAAPTGMAVGARLASMPLTVVRLASVPPAVLDDIEVNERSIGDYEYLAFGQIPTRANASLAEFA